MSFILHHYPMSPFSEKVRAMLGYAGLDWESCITTEAPPRALLMTLSGGYNRIPIAQVGSDIFCDSNLIAREIAALSGHKSLSPCSLNKQQLEKLRFFETKLFFACVNRAFSLGLLGRIAKEKGVFNLLGFLKDRIQMSKAATISMGNPRSAPRIINMALNEVEASLKASDFLGGDQPGLLDFSLYHCVWFIKFVGRQTLEANGPLVERWYQTMALFSEQAAGELTVDQAIGIAKGSKPRALSEDMKSGSKVGQAVTISTNDYRQFPVEGQLVGADDDTWVLKRELETGESVHVHFPKSGYQLTVAG